MKKAVKKVIIGMSGGIDSSVAAYLLKKSGYEVIGVTLKHLENESDENNDSKTCCSLDDIMDAKMACHKIGITHYVVDVRKEFKKEVIDYFLREYSLGKTPSPCIVCDEKIKIKKLIEIMKKMNADYISTGHYADVVKCEKFNKLLIKNAKDIKKDQTYMLYRLDETVIKKILFPLKNYTKEKVREIAKEAGIKTYNKKDSQGICFAPKGYIEFLNKHLKIKSGNFINKIGDILGIHRGYQLYTIGQRRGLNLKLPRAYFITDIKPETNEIIIGDFEELFTDSVELTDCKFIPELDKIIGLKILAKPRFSSCGKEGKLVIKNEKLFFKYIEKNAENAPGQHIVFYYKEKVIGGAVIKNLKR